MPLFCVDAAGGDGSQTDSTQTSSTLDWSKADTSIANLISGYATAFTASGNVIYIGDSHNDPNKAAAWELTGPAANGPVVIISADVTQATPTYKVGTGNQLSSLGGNYNVTFNGSFALYGLTISSGQNVLVTNDDNEAFLAENCVFKLGAGDYVSIPSATSNLAVLKNCTINCAADSGSTTATPVSFDAAGSVEIIGCTFSNVTNRTGVAFLAQSFGRYFVSGCDLSAFSTDVEFVNGDAAGAFCASNCITTSNFVPMTTGRPYYGASVMLTNCGPANAPTYIAYRDPIGDVLSSTAIYRTGGATVEDTACSWLVTTVANLVSEGRPFRTPWIYGYVSSTGSKTFDVYITHDQSTTYGADFKDSEVFLEIEILGTATEAVSTLITNQRHDPANSSYITTADSSHADDTSSTWNGTGPSFTYKQKLSVTGTVNVAGQFRARVCFNLSSITSTHYCYVDPKVTVT